MDGKYISQSLIIVVIFILLNVSNLLAVGVKHIKNNWSLYKCNPMIIPFAGIFDHDPQQTFLDCQGNYNMNFMQYLMEPLKYLISNLGNIGTDIGDQVSGLVNLGGSLNIGLFNIFTNIYGVATNLLVEIQLLILALEDSFKKIIGILVTFLYLLKGIEYAIPSALLTPPGEAIVWIVNTLGQTACNVFMPGGCG